MRIEPLLERQEKVELLTRKLHAHLVDFFNAHAMLAGHRTAHLHT